MTNEPLARFSEKVSQNPSCHILQIDRPFPQVGIVYGRERLDEFVRDALKDKLRVVPLRADAPDDFGDEAGILQHEKMGVKDPRIVHQ